MPAIKQKLKSSERIDNLGFKISPNSEARGLWTPLAIHDVIPIVPLTCMYIFLDGGSIAMFRFSKGFLIPPKDKNLCPKELLNNNNLRN